MTGIVIMERKADFLGKEILLRYFVNYKGIRKTKISTHCVSHHWSNHVSAIWPFLPPHSHFIFLVILNYSHLHKLPYLKGRKIGHQRRPYLRVIRILSQKEFEPITFLSIGVLTSQPFGHFFLPIFISFSLCCTFNESRGIFVMAFAAEKFHPNIIRSSMSWKCFQKNIKTLLHIFNESIHSL